MFTYVNPHNEALPLQRSTDTSWLIMNGWSLHTFCYIWRTILSTSYNTIMNTQRTRCPYYDTETHSLQILKYTFYEFIVSLTIVDCRQSLCCGRQPPPATLVWICQRGHRPCRAVEWQRKSCAATCQEQLRPCRMEWPKFAVGSGTSVWFLKVVFIVDNSI